MEKLMEIDLKRFAKEMALARKEITLGDLTDSQWDRVCNRIANALHQQIHPLDWEEFVTKCGANDITK